MDYQQAPDFLREYLFYMLTIKGRSPRTVEAYYTDLQGFLKYIYGLKSGHKPIDEEFLKSVKKENITLDMLRSVTITDVYEYLNHTLSDNGNTAKTRARKVSSIRSLFKYLTTVVSKLENNPVKDLETPSLRKSMPKYLTLEESLELLQAIDGDQAPRDYCIILLFLNCGMRLSELVGISYGDIRGDRLKILGKGNKERMVFLNEACLNAISQYEEDKRRRIAEHELKVKDKQAFFLSARGTRLTARRVEQIVEEALKKSGLDGKGYSVHKLRHTAATLMYQHGGVDIRVLKEVLGHANVGTTEIYTHVSNEQIERAAKPSPLAHVNRNFDANHSGNHQPLPQTEDKPETHSSPKRRGRPPKASRP